MKGHVPTPQEIADQMVEQLFADDPPSEADRILFPGCGGGPFIGAVDGYCKEHGIDAPQSTAIDSDPELLSEARKRYENLPITFIEGDFLGADGTSLDTFDYVVGNPPYVPIERLDENEKRRYENTFSTAEQRFDLYILFFEQSLELLADGGRLVFVLPEKFEYTHTTGQLRRLMTSYHIESINHISEDTFGGYETYPTITTVHDRNSSETRIIRRDGSRDMVELPRDGSSWASSIRSGDTGRYDYDTGVFLGDVTKRVSCGLATGRDSLFVQSKEEAPEQLVANGWTYPTVSGKQLTLNDGPDSTDVIICPYDEHGTLAPEDELGVYGTWAELQRDELESRSCVEKGKVWYSWHENPPMKDLYGVEKILCKDVCSSPEFFADYEGNIVPRHSVYYIIPKNNDILEALLEYLNSPKARAWIEENAQKAANDYYRMQSTVLKKLPVPEELGETRQMTLV